MQPYVPWYKIEPKEYKKNSGKPYMIYRVNINSFTDYKHLLQENYVEYKHIFCNITTYTWYKSLETNVNDVKKIYFYST
jgi:hypothetical protein